MLRFGDRYRHAVVTRLAHLGTDRDPRERLGPFPGGHPLAAAVAEKFVALAAIRTDEIAHVLDHAENRTMHLPKHLDRARRVEQRNVLGRRQDDGAVQRASMP